MRRLDNMARRRLLIAVATLGVAIVLAISLDHYGLSFLRLRPGEKLPLAVSTPQESPAPSRASFDFQPLDQPPELPAFGFVAGDGRATSFAHFRGRVGLFNLLATWCVPCRREMPALERLQA